VENKRVVCLTRRHTLFYRSFLLQQLLSKIIYFPTKIEYAKKGWSDQSDYPLQCNYSFLTLRTENS